MLKIFYIFKNKNKYVEKKLSITRELQYYIESIDNEGIELIEYKDLKNIKLEYEKNLKIIYKNEIFENEDLEKDLEKYDITKPDKSSSAFISNYSKNSNNCTDEDKHNSSFNNNDDINDNNGDGDNNNDHNNNNGNNHNSGKDKKIIIK